MKENYVANKTNEVLDLTQGLGWPTDFKGCDKFVTKSTESKTWLREMMSNHPYFDGVDKIIFPSDYTREVDRNGINRFANWCELHAETNGYNISMCIRACTSQTLSEENADYVNARFVDANVKAGQRTSRAIRKLCEMCGLTKLPVFDQNQYKTDENGNEMHDENGRRILAEKGKFPAYADAINPLKVTRWTIISVDPVDFLTMSHGSSWASCYTLDRFGEGNWSSINNYSGMHCNGTVAYALDEVTAIMYTVDGEYKGNLYAHEPKVTRQLYMFSNELFVQSRLYPQGNDGGTDMYKQYREILQSVWAECIGTENLWINKKGTSACRKVLTSNGGDCYADWSYFEDTNVSYLKSAYTEEKTYPKMRAASRCICLTCGGENYNSNSICCDSCRTDAHICYHCDEEVSEDDVVYFDGHTYCHECCTYCEWCERYVPDCECETENILVHGHWRTICSECLENDGDFYKCEPCGEYFHYSNPDAVYTEDEGYHYCCHDCAMSDGATYCEYNCCYYNDIDCCDDCGECGCDDCPYHKANDEEE